MTEGTSIDIDQERKRLEKEVARIEPMIEKFKIAMSDPLYEVKVPNKVREINQSKKTGYEAELESVQKALANLSTM